MDARTAVTYLESSCQQADAAAKAQEECAAAAEAALERERAKHEATRRQLRQQVGCVWCLGKALCAGRLFDVLLPRQSAAMSVPLPHPAHPCFSPRMCHPLSLAQRSAAHRLDSCRSFGQRLQLKSAAACEVATAGGNIPAFWVELS